MTVNTQLGMLVLLYLRNFCFSGHIDHSARVMRVITWNRSFRGLPNADDELDDFDSEEHETHATVLDKMLAWEKKLYDEVKVCLFITFLFAMSEYIGSSFFPSQFQVASLRF